MNQPVDMTETRNEGTGVAQFGGVVRNIGTKRGHSILCVMCPKSFVNNLDQIGQSDQRSLFLGSSRY